MNFGDLFDSPLKIAIIAIFIIVLFGSRKLPDAARSLGKSMRILKAEVRGLHEDDEVTTTTTVPAAPAQLQATAPAAPAETQAQIEALSKQLADLQQSVAMNTVPTNNVSDSAQAK
jgi:sec-independent protein translocase protein TatA